MFAVLCAVALLYLTSVSHSAPLDCKNLVKPLSDLDPRHLEGRWALIADSLKIIGPPRPFRPIDSITIDFYNSTYTQSNRHGTQCDYESRLISIEGPNFNYTIGQTFNFTGTVFHTSCPDCVMLSFAMDSPLYKFTELCLFSKRREVDQKEMEEFRAQVECQKMPSPVVMDPTKELCPDRSPHSKLTEAKTEDPKA